MAIADLCTGGTPPAASLDLICVYLREDGSVDARLAAASSD
jgi:hypothetical protein